MFGIAQLSADSEALQEIIQLASIHDKVRDALQRMEHSLTPSYAPLLPSLLWASEVLEIELEPKFKERALGIVTGNYSRISFASKVLVSQVLHGAQ